MRISNQLFAVALGGVFVLPLAADDVTLSDGGAQLAGNVLSINDAGVVELDSELSREPLRIKGAAVEKILFARKVAAPDHPGAVLELNNGDILPVVIESLDEETLTVLSPDAGKLEIPRKSLSSIQLGVEHRKVVYAGPRSLEEWNSGDGDFKNWEYKNRSFVADGSATASRKFALPERFVLRFTLKWQDRQTPNFKIHFADPLLAMGEACDRYFLQFGSAGLEIKREASDGKRYNTVVLLNRTPREFPDRELEVEIRVDRKASRLTLYLNGEPEGEFMDPIASIPRGSGVTLSCNGQSGNVQEISDIEILELDDSRGRHRSEDRGDPENDSLISREDDRWGGRLVDIRADDEGTLLYRFKSDFQDDLLEIPAAEVSTIFFASSKGEKPDAKASPFVLQLNSEGSLRVSSCRFTEETVTAVHPLLGELVFRRDGILAMERTDSKPGKLPKP
jgi:hypothetical protein